VELPAGENFLALIVEPAFVPARISRSNDRRLLGVRLNFGWQLPYRYHSNKVRIESRRFAERGTFTAFWRETRIKFLVPLEGGKYRFRFNAAGTALSAGYPQVTVYTPQKAVNFELEETFCNYDLIFNYTQPLPEEILIYFPGYWDEQLKKSALFFYRWAEIKKLE